MFDEFSQIKFDQTGGFGQEFKTVNPWERLLSKQYRRIQSVASSLTRQLFKKKSSKLSPLLYQELASTLHIHQH